MTFLNELIKFDLSISRLNIAWADLWGHTGGFMYVRGNSLKIIFITLVHTTHYEKFGFLRYLYSTTINKYREKKIPTLLKKMLEVYGILY